MMLHSGELTAVAVVFWVFLAIVSIAGMFQDYRKRKLALEPLRIAIEHGQQLSPEIIATLLGREDRDRERAQTLDPKLLEVGGIITCAAGVGVALLSLFLAQVFPPYHILAMGAGVLALCVGVGLIVAAKSLRR
jgi:hypothetical protein